jgi:hypothetical protein
MSRRVVGPLTVLCLVLGACGSDAPSDADTASTAVTVPPTTPTTPAPAATAAPAASSTTSSTVLETTTTSTVAETTTTIDPAAQALVLSGNGVGTSEFGADPDAVISTVTSVLGEPTNDTGWIDPLSVGACPGTEIRLVDWGVLSLVFGDASEITEGRRHFLAYYYGSAGEVGGAPAGLVTDAGITTGSRVADVKAAYPGVTLNPEDDFTSPFFYVSDSLRGFLTGIDDDSTVTVILGGMGCSE